MELFDVIIVGAGPAGASAAHELALKDMSVLVMDRYAFPRAKPCAGWISPWVFDLIGAAPESYAETATLVPFRSLVVWDDRDILREVRFETTMGYGVIRSEFDAFLASRMKKVKLIQEAGTADIVRDTRDVIINGKYRSPIVIGAGGHRCPIAGKFGDIRPDERQITAVVSETRLGRDMINALTPFPDIPQIILNNDFTGYGWYFPKGDYLNIGIGTMCADRLRMHRDMLMTRLKKKQMLPDPDRFPLNRFIGHAYKLMRISPRRLYTDGVMLAGDAAGIAYNMSGEGIGPAIYSGIGAAETIIEAEGDYCARSLSRHAERLYTRLGTPYPDVLLSAVSSISDIFSPIARRFIINCGVLRRHLMAERWFFRD